MLNKINKTETYIEVFNRIVNKFPNKIAIKSYNEEISYKKLEELASKIVTNLNKLDKNKVIALSSDGTIFHFATMIACMKMRVTFINLDFKSPKNYIDKIIKDLEIEILIISEENNNLKNIYKDNFKDIFCENFIEKRYKNSIDKNFMNETIFIVPTSGSTGTPKYVKKKMNTLMKSYEQFQERVNFLFEKTIEQCAPLNFAFGLELSLIFLATGNTICINEKKDYIDLKYLYKNIEKNNAEIAFWPAPIIKLLSRQPKLIENIPKSLKYIIVGGEPIVVSASLVFEFNKRNIKLLNNYGSTETGTIFFGCMDISLLDVEEFNQVSVGLPLNGFEALILDENLKECTKGYLYIKSDEFLNEYHELEEEQKNKFFKSEKYLNSVLCNMGDICEYKDGKYYIVGRNNNCINIKGYRVEIENIEFFITKILKGGECCVIPFKNKFNEINIICFYDSKKIRPMELKIELEKELPEYMIPKLFIQLHNLYHLKNGKIDREKMKKLYYEKYSTVEKNSEKLEENILNILERILGFNIKKEDKLLPFKLLGLDSLGFTDFISLIEEIEKINIEDNMLTIFYEENISKITDYIIKKRALIGD